MSKRQWLHVAGLAAVILIAVLIVNATGAIELAAGFVGVAAVLLHLGLFASLIAWVVVRVRRDRTGSEEMDPAPAGLDD